MADGFIVDPTDPHRAIAPSGKLAGQVFLVPSTTNPEALTVADLASGKFIGFSDPAEQPFEKLFISTDGQESQ